MGKSSSKTVAMGSSYAPNRAIPAMWGFDVVRFSLMIFTEDPGDLPMFSLISAVDTDARYGKNVLLKLFPGFIRPLPASGDPRV